MQDNFIKSPLMIINMVGVIILAVVAAIVGVRKSINRKKGLSFMDFQQRSGIGFVISEPSGSGSRNNDVREEWRIYFDARNQSCAEAAEKRMLEMNGQQ